MSCFTKWYHFDCICCVAHNYLQLSTNLKLFTLLAFLTTGTAGYLQDGMGELVVVEQ